MADKLITVANGASVFTDVDLEGEALAQVIFPASWTAADLTAQISADGTTWNNFFDDAGNEVTIKAAAGRAVVVAPLVWDAVRRIRFRSGTSGAAVNQGGDRVVRLVTLSRGF